MKIAFFSDIHANLPALEAVLNHIHARNPEAVYCLGDLVNQNVWNNEVVDCIRSHHIPCVLGNHDEGIGNSNPKFLFSYGSREEKKWGEEAVQYTLSTITEENKIFLKSIPLVRRLTVTTGNQKIFIVLAHGEPDSNQKRLYRFTKSEELLPVLQNSRADVLIVGNTHTSFHRILEGEKDGRTCYYHVINPGSVGYPLDGSWHACYAMLNIDEQKDLRYDSKAVTVDFYRLDYDINKVIKALQDSPLHIYYAMRLLKY